MSVGEPPSAETLNRCAEDVKRAFMDHTPQTALPLLDAASPNQADCSGPHMQGHLASTSNAATPCSKVRCAAVSPTAVSPADFS